MMLYVIPNGFWQVFPKFTNRFFLCLSISLSLLSATSCSAKKEITKEHYTSTGYKNPNPNFEKLGFGSLLKWSSTRWKNEHSIEPEDYPKFQMVDNDGLSLKQNDSKLSVTWIGHATTLIQLDGVNILTDPIWSERCSPVSFAGPKRYTQPGIQIENLPNIDIVILSHNHYDHMDLPTLKILETKFHPKFLVGLGNGAFLNDNGLSQVTEMDWWDEIILKGIQIHFTPTQHFSGRGLFDRDSSLWGSYALVGAKSKVYFAGDTGYYTHFKAIGQKFGSFDVAILPIGATEPRWFMAPVHIDAKEAVQAFEDLNAKFFIPMHYQTFVLSDEPLDSPVPMTKQNFLNKKIDLMRLIALKIGESRFFDSK
ncbi:MAG: MBL fold metallo-hydrolase [Leptospira sp.]|nr:MBL fold metallo-hydrolase [Leptospira sp.]